MTAKEYLMQYRICRATLDNKLAELRNVENDIALPQAIRYDVDRVSSSASDDGMFRIFEQMEKRKKDIEEDILDLLRKMHRIENLVDRVENPKHKRLLHLYYIEGVENLEKVADAMIYSPDYARHVHGSALQEFEKIMKDSTD